MPQEIAKTIIQMLDIDRSHIFLTKENAKGAELSLENATSGMTVPFHAGAAKYFAEKGVNVQ